ncbi:alpha/beta hydrolase [uncultured Rubinisphaera sp.]|uniref:alpha/beta hydrolase n=2 Tax=Rubinisphaera TaxID=1649490 RepID=UPI000C0E38FB|nr:xylanase [Rubinisphaera sp.]HCS50060.1 xylanase [Planctomycetaceae bacterium]
MKLIMTAMILAFGLNTSVNAQEVLKVWPGKPSGPDREVGPEQDITKPTDRLIAGRRIIKLANVSTPEIHVYFPEESKQNGSSVVICPGGGFNILAWDLEGTEVAEWLNEIGVIAVVLKYRVPTRDQDPIWKAPVQDTQRAISLVRSKVKEWNLNADRVGVLGFSAGGHTAARAALTIERLYEPIDKSDENNFRPNSAMLIYPAYLNDKETSALAADLNVDESTPPMFIVHAFNDPISVEGSLLLSLELKRKNIPFDLHVYDTGGHGYGLRRIDDQPVTTWPDRCTDWLQRNGWLTRAGE